ncbi:MAG: apolipoprotein N-acyltransferase [Kiritimatiellae bacterium]|nr:apolipoprotein N-acyltransferase [Kiritimatiellia bacterium]
MKMTLIQYGVAILSGGLLASLWEPFSQSGNVWFALVPLLFLLRRRVSLKRSFGLGFTCGFVAWSVQLSWMLSLTETGGPWPLVVPALLGLSAVLAAYIGLFAFLAAFLRQKLSQQPGPIRILEGFIIEPVLWAGIECLRSHLFSGFAWNPLALATTSILPVAQIAAVGGSVALSALVVAVNGAITTIIERFWKSVLRQAPTQWSAKILLSLESVLPFVLFLIVFVWGYTRLQTYQQVPEKRVATVIVERTEVPSIFEEPFDTADFVLRKGKEIADLLPFFKADLWIWPESAISNVQFPNINLQRRLVALSQQADVPLFLGGLYLTADKEWYNAAMLITKEGFDYEQVYGKRHLVPFGEYIPFDRTFPWLQQFVPGGVACVAGEKVKMVTTPSGLRVGPLICFEDTVASVARESVLAGAEILVNMSNDAWYATSAEPEQHAQQAILRTIETGVPMVRSTNHGVNTVIDAVGRVQVIEGFPTRVAVTATPFALTYLRYGEMVFGVPCVMCVLGLIFMLLLGRFIPKRVVAVSAILLVCCMPMMAQANEALLPTAEMSLDDGNVNLAERTARTLLAKIGLTPEDRAKAEEILIRSALKKGEWDAAMKHIEACPELPANRRLAFTLAALSGKGDFAQVLKVYEESQVSTDDSWGVTALRYALLAAQELGKKLLAAQRFEEVHKAKGASDMVKAENALAWDAYLPNEASRAALLEGAQKADRGGVFLSCALALPKAYASVNPKPAIECLESLLALEGLSTTVEARLALTAAQLVTKREDKVTYARRAVSVAREERIRQESLHTLGNLLCDSPSTFTEGISHLNQAVVLNPSTSQAPFIQFKIAEALHASGDQLEALKAYNRYLESYDVPELAIPVRQGKGRLLCALERYDEALALFLEAADIAQTTELRLGLLTEAADAAMSAGRYSRAIDLYRQLLRDGARSGIRLSLARTLEAAGEKEASRKEYLAVREDVSSSETEIFTAAMRLAGMLLEEKRYTEALADYTRLTSELKEDTLLQQVYLERGRIYYLTEQLQNATADFNRVNQWGGEASEEARFFLVLCLYRQGEDEQARELADAYVKVFPDSPRIPDVVLWIAKSDFNRGEYTAAKKEFLTFAERWPNDVRVPNTLYLSARAAFQNQEYSTTVELVGRLAKTFPEAEVMPQARFLQAEALVEQARHAEARDLLEALIRRYPNADWIAEAYGLRGDCLAYTAIDDPERYNLALASYREAVLRLEDDLDISLMYLFRIGRVLERQNLRDDAAEQYTKLIYRVLNCPEISAVGKQWFQKALAQLRAIEVSRGNLSAFETLLRRVRRAQIPGVELPWY